MEVLTVSVVIRRMRAWAAKNNGKEKTSTKKAVCFGQMTEQPCLASVQDGIEGKQSKAKHNINMRNKFKSFIKSRFNLVRLGLI